MDTLRSALPSSGPAGLASVPLLTFWTPGAGVDNFPKGDGGSRSRPGAWSSCRSTTPFCLGTGR